jgi:hypothetical protein
MKRTTPKGDKARTKRRPKTFAVRPVHVRVRRPTRLTVDPVYVLPRRSEHDNRKMNGGRRG